MISYRVPFGSAWIWIGLNYKQILLFSYWLMPDGHGLGYGMGSTFFYWAQLQTGPSVCDIGERKFITYIKHCHHRYRMHSTIFKYKIFFWRKKDSPPRKNLKLCNIYNLLQKNSVSWNNSYI